MNDHIGAPVLTRSAPEDTTVTRAGHQAAPLVTTTQPAAAGNPAQATGAPQPAAITQPAPAVETRAAINGEIRALAQTFGLGDVWANTLIDRGASVIDARAAATEALQARTQVTSRITVGPTLDPSPAEFTTRAAEALFARANPSHQLSAEARPFFGLTAVDLARETLRRAGISAAGLPPGDILTRSLQTTSDFSAIFADTANRILRTGYTMAPAVLKRLGRQTTAKDFRAKTTVQFEDGAKLEKVGEGGEYRRGGFVEATETYKIDTYGKTFGLSRQALINDDLGAFNDLAGKLGMAAAEFEAQFLTDLLVSGGGYGPTMADGQTLFHSTHGNRTDTAAILEPAAVATGRLALRRQKSLAGRPISVVPKFLLVPPELELAAEKVVASISPATVGDTNPFAGKLEVLVEPRLVSPTRWYLVGDPAAAEGLEYAYLLGAEGPQTESRNGFDVDGVEIKVRLDFGADFIDWRAWYTAVALVPS